MQSTTDKPMQSMEQCIQNCLDCHSICTSTLTYCLTKGGMHAEPAHITLLQDCAQMCITSADFMLRTSQFHAQTCGACAQVNEACAADCEQMGDDAQMQRCAEACRRCASSCHEMAGMAA